MFLGFVTLALAVIGALAARRRLAAWIWTALVFGVLALGPLLQIAGRYRFSLDNLLPEGVTFPLPFTLLHFLPFISANRAPNRNSTILMLALAVLAGYGVAWLLGKISKWQMAIANQQISKRQRMGTIRNTQYAIRTPLSTCPPASSPPSSSSNTSPCRCRPPTRPSRRCTGASGASRASSR